jgi:hypothetical protein
MTGFADSFETIQAKLDSLGAKEGVVPTTEDATFEDLDKMEVKDEDVDKVVKESEEIVIEDDLFGKSIKEEKIEVKPTKEQIQEEKIKEAIAKDLINHLGEDTILNIKGKQYPLKNLSKDEIVKYLQIGMRPNQIYDDLAAQRKEIELKEATLTRGAETVQRLMEQYGTTSNQGMTRGTTTIPDILKPSELDTDEVKALKQLSLSLSERVGSVEKNAQQSNMERQGQAMMAEINALKNDYPAASIEEAIAIKSYYPDIPLDKIMEHSHKHYASKEYLDTVFKADPTIRREVKEEMVKEYLAQKAKAKVIPRKSGASGLSIETGKTKPVKSFEDADEKALAHLQAIIASQER